MIDCHAHLSAQEPEIIAVELERAVQAGVVACVNVCTNMQELKSGLELAQRQNEPRIYTAASTTPHDVIKADPAFIKEIEVCANQLVAIGETGLDYYYEHSPKNVQQEALCAYIELANRVHLPLVIHCRDAFADLFSIFDSFTTLPPVMLHCFTGTLDEAKEAEARGFYISFSGIVTFRKSAALQEVAAKVGSGCMLIETDCPYLAPLSKRGQKNEPSFIVETAATLARLRNVPVDTLIAETTANAKRLFHFH